MNKEALLKQLSEGIDKLVEVKEGSSPTSDLEGQLKRLWENKEMQRWEKVELLCVLLDNKFGG